MKCFMINVNKFISAINIVFVLNLMSKTSYGWYIFIDLVIISLNLYIIFRKDAEA